MSSLKTADAAAYNFQPFVRTSCISDVVELEPLYQGAECFQLSPGEFSGSQRSTQIGAVRIFEHTSNRGIQVRKFVGQDRLFVGFLKDADAVLEHGGKWPADEVLILSGADLHLSTLGSSDIVWTELQLESLAPLERQSLTHSLRPAFLERGRTAAYSQLRGYIYSLLQSPSAESSPAGIDRTWQDVEREIFRRVAGALASGRSEAIQTERQRRGFVLAQRVERFMLEHVSEPLTLDQICTNTGCRTRCLIYSFKDSFGLAPMTYLKVRRLNAVHRKLMCSGGNVRILDIAADFGFWHMGHFSTDYRRMFGSTASQTIAASRFASH